MYNLIQADLFKLRKSLSIKILFLLSCMAGIGMAYMSYFMTKNDLGKDLIGIASLLADFQMMGLIGSITCATFICGDFENKTIHDAISSGSSRKTLILSKAFVYFLVIGLMIIPYVIVAIVGFCSKMDFTPFLPSVFLNIMANEGDLTLTAPVFLKIIALSFSSLSIYLGQLSISFLLAFIIKKPIAVIGISYGINAALPKLATIPGLKDILSFTPLGIDYATLTLKADILTIIKPILFSVIFIAIIIAITNKLFKKAEIK